MTTGRKKYHIEYSRGAVEHLRFLTAREQEIVLDVVDRSLTYEADVETRNRKPIRPLWRPGNLELETFGCIMM